MNQEMVKSTCSNNESKKEFRSKEKSDQEALLMPFPLPRGERLLRSELNEANLPELDRARAKVDRGRTRRPRSVGLT